MKRTIKTTIELPDELYRQVKAKSAMEGLHVREVTIALYQQWLAQPQNSSDTQNSSQWLDEMMSLVITEPKNGPTARAIVEEDRSRLDIKSIK
ncbi:MAG: hypothetical protein GX804_01090 [Lentisphaerae bacterium]|jgi:hypothetical protein|nr:hypothetical protein [Lentisphaerota bacterium]